jgi:hypothetical protein
LVAAVLNRRWSTEKVREFVEMLYANEFYSIGERIAHAKGCFNPYPAKRGTLNGVPWDGEIFCGHNPFLYARLVDGLRVEGEGEGSLMWEERERPRKVRKVRQ